MQTPTAFEQEMLELTNRARMDPTGEFDRLILNTATSTAAAPNITSAIRFFNTDLDLFKQQLDGLTPLAPLAWNTHLATAAETHSGLMITHDTQSHNLPGEADLLTRIQNAGYSNVSRVAENIFAYTDDPLYGHAGFFIDWGNTPTGIQSPPGHRNTILNAALTEIGIAALPDNSPATSVGPHVVTQNFGNRFNYEAQLVGVVIEDQDQDAFYDAGEGLGGVTISAVRSGGGGSPSVTTSWSAGGYQMQLAAGSYEVTFSGGGLQAIIVKSVTIGSENVKLDVLGPTSGAETLIGTSGADSLPGLAGNDAIYARAGNDLLEGGAGFDTLDGGAGNDTLVGGDGRDRAIMGAGNDLYQDNGQGGDLGRDTVFGNQGNDTIQGGNGDDEFHGQLDNDLIFGRLGNDKLFGGDGFDTLDGGNGNDTINGGNGRDKAIMGAGNDIFFDNGQGGVNGQDTVFANQGNDTIQGGNGNDEFHGQLGNDVLFGRLGNDKLFGGDGFDTMHGGDGNDSVHGGNGRDVAYLGNGNDIFFDNGQGGDLGRDNVFAGAGNDTIQGGNGNDTFRGEAGNDVIFGRLGDDLITGGAGNDTLDGGEGADTFVFGAGFGVDVVNGYQIGGDTLQLDDALWVGTLTTAQVVTQFASIQGGNAVFDFGADIFTLSGVNSLTGIENDLLIV